MRFLILALCPFIFVSCYTIPYSAPKTERDRIARSPQPVIIYEAEHNLAVSKSIYDGAIPVNITFMYLLYNRNNEEPQIVLKAYNPEKDSTWIIKPQYGKEFYIGRDYTSKSVLSLKDIDFPQNQINFYVRTYEKIY